MSSVFSFQLRYLQTLNSISAENNSTVIFPVPIDIMSQLMNRPQPQFPSPMFMPQQQPLQPQQMGPQTQQQQQQMGAGGQMQSYPKSSLKKTAPPAPTHAAHQRLTQGRRSVRKSKVRGNNWFWVLCWLTQTGDLLGLYTSNVLFMRENIISARLKGSSPESGLEAQTFEIFSRCYGQKVGNVMLLAVLPGLCVKVTQVMTIKAPTPAHKWSWHQ